jgi:hypothetical protein
VGHAARHVPTQCPGRRRPPRDDPGSPGPPRNDLGDRPICSGAESFLAGTASCRIEVADVDALFAELEPAGVLHDVSRGGVGATDFGTREFATLDLDGNLLTFFHREE